jgi:signal transduction histidine kinase
VIEAPHPDDEQQRLAALLELRILDTPAEERFDRITRIARELFAVPVALVSLVDANRQWFKSAAGLDARETPRAISFCAHAIYGDDALVVEDALADPRFFDNPLVLGAPGVRFYAGFPLRSRGGRKLGTLCLIDRAPRRFGTAEVQHLRDLAAWAEAELLRHDEIAAQTAEMRDSFVRLVSHELRTPVTSIAGALELMRAELPADAEIEALAQIAAEGAAQLSRSVDDILAIARLDAGDPAPEVRSCELAPLVAEIIDAWLGRAAQAGVALTAAVPPGLAALAVPHWLSRVLDALVENAVRFSPRGAAVAVSAVRTEPHAVRIEVADGGPGIPAALLPRLFQAFAQADAGDNRRHSGFGLGLALSRRLAATMGARLGYAAGEGGGSRFILDLRG